MSRPSARAILSDVLNGERLVDAALVAELLPLQEGLWLEFKSGREFDDTKKAGLDLRRAVAGFANGEGGIVVFGATNVQPRVVDGCPTAVGGSSLHDWATRALDQLAPLVAPPIHINEINHTDGKVLLVSVPRSVCFVHVQHQGRTLHPLRFGESTLDAPEYLIADLALGRRQGPSLDIRGQLLFRSLEPTTDVSFPLVVENTGFVRATGLRVGVVSWSLGAGTEIPAGLRTYIDPKSPPARVQPPRMNFRLLHTSTRLPLDRSWDDWLAPFSTCESPPFGILLPGQPDGRGEAPAIVLGGLYVLADAIPPVWYQVKIPLTRDPKFNPGHQLQLRRLWDQRALIAYEAPPSQGQDTGGAGQ